MDRKYDPGTRAEGTSSPKGDVLYHSRKNFSSFVPASENTFQIHYNKNAVNPTDIK